MARETARHLMSEVVEVLRSVVAFAIVVLMVFAVVISFVVFTGFVAELWLGIPVRDTVPVMLQTTTLLTATIALGAWLGRPKTSDVGIVQTSPGRVPELQDVSSISNDLREKLPRLVERETRAQPSEEAAIQHPTSVTQVREPSPPGPEPPPPSPSDVFWTPRTQGKEDLSHPVARETLIPPQHVEQPPEHVQLRFAVPDQIMTRISDVSFKCSFCHNTLSVPWEKVEHSEKGEKVTVDCPYCQGQLAFESVVGKMLTLSIHPV